ncbi:MAG: glycosyltransferase [Oscillospiraceae bacterium]|jgi:glycosyltransferase involved in cell wall biosynthesis|nr:glycosyltransferase [Oscillospiraceae bacterium]
MKKDKKIKVSIIFPVYNVEKYLNESLKALKNQTIDNIEIICIDDGSTDNSLETLKKHSKRDERIKIIKQKHRGVSVARNKGLKMAEGEYILFADSDDVVDVKICEVCYKNAKRSDSDILIFEFLALFNEDYSTKLRDFLKTNKKKLIKNSKVLSVNNIEDKLKMIDGVRLSQSVIWNKFYKRSFLIDKKMKFKENIKWGEDIIFSSITFPIATKVSYISDILYYYRLRRKNSICTSIKPEEKIDEMFKIINIIVKYYKSNDLVKNNELWLLNKFFSPSYRYLSCIKDFHAMGIYRKKILNFIFKKMFS